MATGAKRPQERLKLTIRLLPPGLTEVEFKAAIGLEWLVGGGKVDWMAYAPGKISKNPSKHSKPATAWLHLTDSSSIAPLEEKVRSTSFLDAKNTINDPVLPGHPVLEYAISQKIPSTKKRVDSRMGTIDQDPDFKRFLESLTNPIQKAAVDLEASLHKEELKVTTTPLIEHLREKKAAKEAKPSSKGGKDGRESGKNKRKGKDVSLLSTSSSEKSKKSGKADRAAKQSVKVLTRQASTTSTGNSSSQTSEKVASTTTSSAPAQSERRRDRAGPFNIAAKIQRDLGLGPAAPRRGTKGKAATNEPSSNSSAGASAAKEPTASESKHTTSGKIPDGPRKTHRGGRNNKQTSNEGSKEADQSSKSSIQPTILKKPSSSASAAQPSSSSPKPTPVAPSSSTTTSTTNATPTALSNSPKHRAFLKHANPSQGITEPLLHTALSTFGSVLAVEIDKRKGIAHADFGDAAGLATAIKAGKVDVANGAVQVLPFRERSSAKGQGGGTVVSGGSRGGSNVGRGGGRASRGRGSGAAQAQTQTQTQARTKGAAAASEG
jgi:regulator of nonsense transcripts 3